MTKHSSKNYALIVAAGRGYRAGGDLPKQYRKLSGKSVIRYSVETFINSDKITEQ